MRTAILQFLAGFCGAVGCVLLLLSLGTDYWLLASESCDSQITGKLTRVTTEDGLQEESGVPAAKLLSYHEGIFWRCTYRKDTRREKESVLNFWITNQASEKTCMQSYLSHVPPSGQADNILAPDSTTVHRAFWCILAMLGLTAVVIGVFITICGIPTGNRRIYEAGGAFFITGGVVQLVLVVLFAVWVQGSSSLERYVQQRRLSACANLHLVVYYGPSFMLGPAASFFCVLCGLLLVCVHRRRGAEVSCAHSEPPSTHDQWATSTL
ncbi:transmembrane protein 182 [Brachyhypopomus gauderio]|uniref:transmembrane protein 182 n=1 Tax=Brachyhypopomus gauderio TaxID=698409 RepID=UPI0040420940